MAIILPRRRFIQGLVGLVAAPDIVKATSLMPVKVFDEPLWEMYLDDDVYTNGLISLPYATWLQANSILADLEARYGNP